MARPTVAIVGKPNVGKSTFFNYLIGERKSIVEDTPGVTRDRVYGETNWRGRKFTLIDTGGIEEKSQDVIASQMRIQAEIAIELSDVVVFMKHEVNILEERVVEYCSQENDCRKHDARGKDTIRGQFFLLHTLQPPLSA